MMPPRRGFLVAAGLERVLEALTTYEERPVEVARARDVAARTRKYVTRHVGDTVPDQKELLAGIAFADDDLIARI